MDSISTLKDMLGVNKCELNGTVFDSWKGACSSLQSQYNELRKKVDEIENGGGVTKGTANCGEQIKTEGCVNC